MARPKLKIKKDVFDLTLEWIGIICVVLIFLVPILYYSDLPDKIPMHFSHNGKPDRFGDKHEIWILPIIGSVIYFGLYFLNRFPHIFNYLQKITPNNAQQQYTLATKLIRIINTLTIVLFMVIISSIVAMGMGTISNLPLSVVWVFLGLVGIVTVYFFFKLAK